MPMPTSALDRAIREMQSVVGTVFTTAGRSTIPAQRIAADQLARLASAFAAHVDETEGIRGSYAQSVDTAPWLSARAECLVRDHLALRSRIDQLSNVLTYHSIAHAGLSFGEATRREVDDLLGRLGRHLQRDSDLVYDAVCMEHGGGD